MLPQDGQHAGVIAGGAGSVGVEQAALLSEFGVVLLDEREQLVQPRRLGQGQRGQREQQQSGEQGIAHEAAFVRTGLNDWERYVNDGLLGQDFSTRSARREFDAARGGKKNRSGSPGGSSSGRPTARTARNGPNRRPG